MKLQEILEEIAEKYPHNLSNASVIRKINNVQNELFRTSFRQTTSSVYGLQKDVFIYTLPFPFNQLTDVVVNGVELPYQDTKQQSVGGSFYYFIGRDGLGIFPTPTKDDVTGLELFYYMSPTQLTEADLNVVPDLDKDFHMLLVYGALVQIAENYTDVAMVNNYTVKYNDLLDTLIKVTNERPDYPVIDDVMGGGLF